MSEHQSHGGSSDGNYDNDALLPDAQWHSQQEKSPNPLHHNMSSSDQPPRTPVIMQKRRRVTRACDECRRKKIKCDGKQPCTHCTVYSYECTYDQPSNRRRNPAPEYVEALENRLQRAESLLKTVLPDVDLDDPNLDVASPQRVNPTLKVNTQPLQADQMKSWLQLEKGQHGSDGETDSLLESMVTRTGTLDLDDEGNWDFHGHSSGRIFLRKMRNQFGDLIGKPDAMPFMRYNNFTLRSQPVESPGTLADSPMYSNLPRTHDLPDKHCAQLLCGNALDDAGAIMRVVHQPTFYAMLHRVYDIPYEEYGDEEHKFLPLLYGVLALGSLFARADQSQLQKNGYENAIDQGYHWFRVSRQMIDLTECRDLTSLQAVLYMILFLQSSARLSTCYAYLGIVLRSSIRMGLHRSVSNAFNPVERELRKRIFWVIRRIDIYVGALLGLPQMLSSDDIDQDLPMEVDDEYITTEGVSPMPSGKLSVFAALNAHTHLVEILAKTVKYIYPIKGNQHGRGKDSQSYVVSHTRIREIEQDLQGWMENLPMPFRPGEEASPGFMRIRHLLRMGYAHIQMFLYRPFLHYISPAVRKKTIDQRSYACAAACVSVSRNIVHLTGQMKRKGLLEGSYWFYMYTTFFAIISLVFYVLENPQSPKVEDIFKDAHEGKDTLAALSDKSLAADKCSTILAELFEQLPSKLQGLQNTVSHKKRQAPSQLTEDAPPTQQNAPNITAKSISTSNVGNNIQHTSSSSTQQSFQSPSILQDPMKLGHPVVPSTNSTPRRSSEDPYSPSNPNYSGIQTSNDANSSIQSNENQATYGTQKALVRQGVPELSAMMFPSADPFAYPNQPMTTLENCHVIKQENQMNSSAFDVPRPTTTDAPYDMYDAQTYDHIPPYMMQGQPPDYLQGMNPPMNMNSEDPNITLTATQGFDGGYWPLNQQQRMQGQRGMGFDQLFGEDWGGFMNQYRQ